MVVVSEGVMVMRRSVSTTVRAHQTAGDATVLGPVLVIVGRGQTRLDHRLETIDEQFDVVRILSRDGERTGESPQTAETARLQVTQLLLLTGVVTGRTGDHLVDDRLHGGQDRFVVRQRENRIDFRVQQIVNDGKDSRKDDARLRQILVDDAHLVLIRGVSHECGQDGQQKRLSRRVRDHIRIQQQIRLAIRLKEETNYRLVLI